MRILYVHQYFGTLAGTAFINAVETREPAPIPADELSEGARVTIEAATQTPPAGKTRLGGSKAQHALLFNLSHAGRRRNGD